MSEINEINPQFVIGMKVPELEERKRQADERILEAERRQRAAFNACRVISTAALEAGVVEKMVGLVKTASEGYQNGHKQVDLEVVLEGKTKEIIKLLEGKK